MLSMMSWLVPLAGVAFADIGVDELAHTRPPIVPVQDFKRFCLTRMSRDDRIVRLFKETDAERFEIRDNYLSFEQEKTIFERETRTRRDVTTQLLNDTA